MGGPASTWGPGDQRAVGLLLGALADALLGDPRRWHPVAGYGRLAGAAERRWWADSRGRGAAYAGGFVVAPVLVGAGVERLAAPGWRRVVVTAAATWVVLGGRSLVREAMTMTGLLGEGDLPRARERLRHLAGRDATDLSADELARASVESVAENTSDAVVAPLLWGAVSGVPGLLGYRAVNTLDAMVGHRTTRYLRFGWAAARLDDVANLLPSRVTALLAALLAPVVGGRTLTAVRVWRRDAAQHPSPNAGPAEAAFAGALGVRLGGRNAYEGRVEQRGLLGTGDPPSGHDLARSVRLAAAVDVAAVLLAAVVARTTGRRR